MKKTIKCFGRKIDLSKVTEVTEVGNCLFSTKSCFVVRSKRFSKKFTSKKRADMVQARNSIFYQWKDYKKNPEKYR